MRVELSREPSNQTMVDGEQAYRLCAACALLALSR